MKDFFYINIINGTKWFLRSRLSSAIIELIVFIMKFIMVDIQFKGLKDHFKEFQANMNIVSKKEHVPEIKRFIRVIKERARAYFSMIPFIKVPKKMVLELIHTVIFYLNAFPWTDGVSQELCPTTIVEG